jgi:lipoprotein-anchoring transpeptidase ErfK/SrfK
VRADATIDLRRLVLTIDGRMLPISAGTVKAPTPTGRMTVTAKEEAKTVASDGIAFPSGYNLKALWVLELRAADGRTTYLAALTYDDKAPGNYDTTGGWIGLRTADAQWLYGQLRKGSVVDVESSLPAATVRPPAATSPSASRTRAPETAPAG